MAKRIVTPSTTKWLYLLFLASVLAFTAFRFTQSQLRNSLPAPSKDNIPQLKKVNSPTAFFYTEVFGAKENTFISVPFSFPADKQPLWLYLAMQEGTPRISRLMFHPQLASLDWPKVENDQVTLYQKTAQYDSVDAFLQDPPGPQTVVMDSYLTQVDPYQKIQGETIPTDESIDIDAFQFILTTFKTPRQEGDIYYYETTLDASTAQVNEDEELNWLISAPQASADNPYSLAEIHVDYR